jgi:hypothetical protein
MSNASEFLFLKPPFQCMSSQMKCTLYYHLMHLKRKWKKCSLLNVCFSELEVFNTQFTLGARQRPTEKCLYREICSSDELLSTIGGVLVWSYNLDPLSSIYFKWHSMPQIVTGCPCVTNCRFSTKQPIWKQNVVKLFKIPFLIIQFLGLTVLKWTAF